MWDTFRPLKLTTLWRDVDNPAYAYSWNEDKTGSAAEGNGAGPAGNVTVTGPSA